MSLYPLVNQPFTINGCELRNRIVRAAHGTGFVDAQGLITDRLISYHLERARGGIGLTILETSTSDPMIRGRYLDTSTDEQLLQWSRLAAACHAEGMKLFQQMYHPGPSGAQGSSAYLAPRSLAATAAGRPHNPFVPLALTKEMIDYHVECFAAGAARVKESGIDGVEIHAAHGYLLADFLSPLSNQRTDDYGGSPENRMRFVVEIIEAVRKRVGAGFPVGVRLSGSEGVEGGLTPQDVGDIALRLEASGLIDYVSLTSGSYFRPWKIFGAMHEPRGYELPDSRQVTRRLSLPTIVTGKFLSLADAEKVLEDGDADLVSMVRATIAEPHLVRKSMEGRAAEVRPCISCNQNCIGGLMRVGSIGCVVNVRVGAETRPIPPPVDPRTVVVVGAGPAGMEAALTAAGRGHRVEIYEASDAVGGAVRFARRAPYRADIGRIVDFQASELKRLGIKVHLNASMTAEKLNSLNPAAVIVAAGGAVRRDGVQRFNPRGVQGAGLPHVTGPAEVLAGDFAEARKAVVYDDFGQYPAVAVTEYLLEHGVDVTFVTSEQSLGTVMAFAQTQTPTLARLYRYPSFHMISQQYISAIDPRKVTLSHLAGEAQQTVQADLVVLCTATEPRRELFDAFPDDERFILAGDALGHGDLAWAIASGTKAGEAVAFEEPIGPPRRQSNRWMAWLARA